jgi:hypothetical protein
MITHEITSAASVADEVGPLAAAVGSSLGPMGSAWWTAWARHLMRVEGWQGELRCVVVRDSNQKMRAFMPFAIHIYRGIPIPSLAGNYFPFRSFVMDPDPAVVSELARALRKRFWIFRLGPCPRNDTGLRTLVRELLKSSRLMLQRPAGTRFMLEDAQAARAEGWPKASLLKRFQYYERRLAKRGDVKFETIDSESPLAIQKFLARAGEVEKRSWVAGDQRGDLKIAPRESMAFWSEILGDPGVARLCKLSLLSAGNQDLAFQLGLEFSGTKIIIANGYDESMAEFNPGSVAIWKDIDGAMERGIVRIDYGVGDGGYKQRLGFKSGSELVDVLASCIAVPNLLSRRIREVGGFNPINPDTWT